MGLDEELSESLDSVLLSVITAARRKSGIGGRDYHKSRERIIEAFIKAGWTKPDPTRILGDE